MKILKNMFNSKSKQNTKYETNTLAEMNGSPDLRLATAKEKEVNIPLPKAAETKKPTKSTSKSSGQKKKAPTKSTSTTNNQTPISHDNSIESEPIKVVKSTKKSDDASTAKQKSTNKSTSAKKSSIKETDMKKQTTKAVETKKTTSTTDKKADDKTKPVSTKSANKTPDKSSAPTKKEVKKDVKPATAITKEVKKDAKPASTSKKEVKNDVKPVATANKEVKPTYAVKKSTSSAEKQQTEAKTVSHKKSASNGTATKKSVEKTKNTSTQKKSEDPEIISESKTTKSGKFEIKKSKDGRFVFNLYASNNIIVATSQVYTSSTSAMNGIKSVIANASSAPIEDQSLKKVIPVPYPKWEIYIDKGDEYRFRLCASNGSCVCHSQGYTTKANCKKGIESIIKFANDAEITKVYLEKK